MIRITNARKEYKSTVALDNVNLELLEGGIYCLLGRNGAGKTTLLKAIAGHIDLTAGEIYVNDGRVGTLNMPESLSYIEAQTEMFNMKVKDLLFYTRELADDFDDEFAEKMIQKFKLDGQKRFRELSFGMKTMLSTLLSLSNKSSVVMLDEPVLGFDAIMRGRFYELLSESVQRTPRIIIVSTHIIDEISRVAEKIIIIDKGKILAHLDINEIDDKAYEITGKTEDVEAALAGFSLVNSGLNLVNKRVLGGFTTAVIFDKRMDAPKNCTVRPLSLQDYFINLVGGEE